MPLFARSSPCVPDRHCYQPVRATRHEPDALCVESRLLLTPLGLHSFKVPHPVRTLGERYLASARNPSDPLACLAARLRPSNPERAERAGPCQRKSTYPARPTRRVWPLSKTKHSLKSITSARTNTRSPAP